MARARLGDYLALSPAWRWLSKHYVNALGPARQLREQSSWVFFISFRKWLVGTMCVDSSDPFSNQTGL